MTLKAFRSTDPNITALLERHPKIELLDEHRPGVQFFSGDWFRSVTIGGEPAEVSGLTELMDNNPMVCADQVGVPSPAATLALIALGPLFKTEFLVESPVLITSFDHDEDVESWLKTVHPDAEVTSGTEPVDTGSLVAASAIAQVHGEVDVFQLRELYRECYERSFFVREWPGGAFTDDVVGTPLAHWHIAISPGDGAHLVKVRVVADRHGKAGAAQAVHALNVMAGFEESLPFAAEELRLDGSGIATSAF